MKTLAHNRLSGHSTALPDFALAGLWASQDAGLLHGLAVPEGTLLLPDVRGLLTWSGSSETSHTVRFPNPGEGKVQLGSLDLALVLLTVGEACWDDWVSVSPMDLDLAQELQRFPLEESMEQDLSHLEAVCRQPRTHLEIFEERQLVSRARQIPVRAVNYLASHTEDWEGRTLRGVRPRRVITNVRDELFDIYENRVAVRLVDHLTYYVRRRLARIKELAYSLQTVELNAQEPPSGMHWRQKRIYELWGEALDLTEAQLLAADRIEELNRYLYRLERLRGSPLYSSVPAKVQIAAQLKITNILGNDPHYRRVARLWLSWYRHAHISHPSLKEQQETAQREVMQFDRYALLLTVHALNQFEFIPVVDRPLQLETVITLSGPEGVVDLSWNRDGTCSLYRSGKEILRVVASPTPLSDLRIDEISKVIETLAHEASALPCQAVLLYYGDTSQVTDHRFHSVSGDPDRIHPFLSCLPVSAVDLESVERVARVLRWVLTGERFKSYPPVIETDVEVPIADLPADTLRNISPGRWELREPMKRLPASWMKETRRLETVLGAAEQKIIDQGRERLKVRQAQRAAELIRQEVEAWKAFINAVESGEQYLDELRRCSVCGTEQGKFSVWEDHQFNCECEDCGAQWSLRRCRDCQQYHAWLLPHLREVCEVAAVPGWADKLYGRDILTLPNPYDLSQLTCPVDNDRTVS